MRAQRKPEKKAAAMTRMKPMASKNASPATIMMTPMVIVMMIEYEFYGWGFEAEEEGEHEDEGEGGGFAHCWQGKLVYTAYVWRSSEGIL